MVRSTSKNGCQKDICSKEIGVCALNMMMVSIQIVNTIWGGGERDLHDLVHEHENLHYGNE
jgi:hypothetical protein